MYLPQSLDIQIEAKLHKIKKDYKYDGGHEFKEFF